MQNLGAAVRYRIARHLVIGPFLFVYGRPRVTGQENIPKTGPVILAANHLAVSDSFFIVQCARRPVMFLAKSDYFTQSGIRGRLKKAFFAGMGQIPVDRAGGAKASPAIDAATGIVSRGGAWGIHPEGTRSPDGRMYRGKTGVVRVAVATGTPIAPIAITGTDNRTRGNFWKSRVAIDVLAPLDLSDVPADDESKIRAATDELMATLRSATGQDYVDAYATRGGARK